MSSAGWMLLVCSLIGVWSLAGFCYYKLLFEDSGDSPGPDPSPAAPIGKATEKAPNAEKAPKPEKAPEAEEKEAED